MQSLTRSLSVSIVIWFPYAMSGVSECVPQEVSMVLVVFRPYVHHIIYSDKHISVHEEIEISPPKFSEEGSLRSPIIIFSFYSKTQ